MNGEGVNTTKAKEQILDKGIQDLTILATSGDVCCHILKESPLRNPLLGSENP